MPEQLEFNGFSKETSELNKSAMIDFEDYR